MSRDYQHVYRQGSEDGIAFNTGIIHGEPESINASGTETAWLKRNILGLDGGGIRGYWSLLTLEKLMGYIAEVEEEEDATTYHSFSPQPWPRDVSQIPLTKEERNRVDGVDSQEDIDRALPCTRRYLPCHYFDSICGSSTGALIAIMLGRFRMTVPDCIYEYRILGQEVFGNPRFFTAINFGVGNRYKYKAAGLEKVFKEVTKRRSEKLEGEVFGQITFPSGRGLCTTFVTTKKSQPGGLSTTPYLIRSYDHDRRTAPNHSAILTPRTPRDSRRVDTGLTADGSTRIRGERNGRINYRAQQFEIWQVARAATAAPFYFEPLKVEQARTSEHIFFTDGGFSHTNNPTLQGKREIEDLHGNNSIGIVVSVGTARKKKEETGPPGLRFLTKIRREMKGWAHEMSDPEEVHHDMQRAQENQGFPYYRLNDPEGLDIELDRWEPKQSLFSKDAGSKTIATITNAFSQWASEIATVAQLKSCARKLVECRRNRMSTLKWERYATGARYRCQYQGCDIEDFFDGRTFRDHLRTHGILEHLLNGEVGSCRHYWRYQARSVSHAP